MAIIFKPISDILKICDIIDNSIERFLKAKSKVKFGRYEHETTAFINILHSIRLLESIVELARIDLVYVQSALVLSRSIFEGLIRTSWILFPNDKFINETRYVAYLETEYEYLDKISKDFGGTSKPETNLLDIKEQVALFKNDLSQLLMQKGYSIPKLPNLRKMLKDLKEEGKYLYYIILSQYSHFSHHSSKIYQKNMGIYKILTETEQIDLWKFSFATTFPIFRLTTELFLASLGNTDGLYLDSQIEEFEKLIQNK